MNDCATPETFKPGERWLVYLFDFGQRRAIEVYCREWSLSKKYVKIEFAQSGTERWENSPIRLIERLPNESNDNQAAAAAEAVEGDSAKPCEREDCRRIQQELTQRIIREAAQEIPEGKTFTVATQAEIAAQSEHNGAS